MDIDTVKFMLNLTFSKKHTSLLLYTEISKSYRGIRGDNYENINYNRMVRTYH